MTKVQVHYDLTRPLDGALLERVSSAHGLFGLQRVQLAPSMDRLVVEYDASRLTIAQVDAALRGAGIPAQRRAA